MERWMEELKWNRGREGETRIMRCVEKWIGGGMARVVFLKGEMSENSKGM